MSRAAAFAAALSGLPGMGPATLVRILAQHDPEAAWHAVRAGRIERPTGAGRRAGMGGGPAGSRPWAEVAARVDPVPWWRPFAGSGVRVTWRGQPDYPAALVHDPHPPGVLFWRGELAVLDLPAVALVGTRNATPDGRSVAFELGRDLAAAGICVVSGLALGIDGAAHRGCLQAVADGGPGAPAGVAASGVDVPYPRSHAGLWGRVVEAGVIVSETLPGRPAQAWRFPSRNRVIAGLVRMVVVVESHAAGGSLITAEAALERGVDVRVVPGPVRSPASAGSNQLLYDGPGPVRSARDVLDAMGMILPDRPGGPPPATRPGPGEGPAAAVGPLPPPSGPGRDTAAVPPSPGRGPQPGRSGGIDHRTHRGGIDQRGPAGRPAPADPADAGVLAALGRRPATVGQIMARSGFDASTVVRCLHSLLGREAVVETAGWWSRT